ncbi:extracellular solute-binding protein [Methylocapsa sp. S129]|uniref:extracellular solute-binding protein n=1 Tax=Methylocapsa sp. S129 TaxID=1641869 RepID=UPI00131D1392|nr:extracellular solute-binding protein [Methylocapsa sp. S129]
MASGITRRSALKIAAAGLTLPWALTARAAFAEGEIETHGLSAFGDLALPPDFKHFDYVNPNAPKGGLLSLQITSTGGNQNFDTFDTLNMFSKKGDGAAGMTATFDNLMTSTGDEPDSVYGLLARAVRYSQDKLTYRFLLRPEARFSDGSRLTASDIAFSLNTLKEKGHPTFSQLLTDVESVAAEAEDVATVRFIKERSRDAHLIVAGMPIFSQDWWKTRDFDASTMEAPLGSGPYKMKTFEQGRFIEFELVKDYWAKDLPVNVGVNNFQRLRFEYYRERQVAFEAFKAGSINFHEELNVPIWVNGYDFPSLRDGRVKKEVLHNGAPTGNQAWYFNLRREQFKDPRVREAIGLAFDFEWTNKNVKYSSTKRVVSYFQNTDMEAKGPPGPDELALLEPFRGKVSDAVFGEPYLPPVSDGSGSDRQLLRRANDLLLGAGCKRQGGALSLPDGKPFVIEFLDFSDFLQPVTTPFIDNLHKLGIDARLRIVDSAQYKARTENFDFDVVPARFGGSPTPGVELRIFFGSAAATQPGSRNMGGVADPVVDALIEKIANAQSRVDLNAAAKALDRVLRAGHYWVPMYYRDEVWIAYWDAFSRPERQPRLGTGAPDTWWWDEQKAKKIGL